MDIHLVIELMDTLCSCPLVLLLVSPFAFCPTCCVSGCAVGLLWAVDDDAHALAGDRLKHRFVAALLIFKTCQYLSQQTELIANERRKISTWHPPSMSFPSTSSSKKSPGVLGHV